MLSTGKKNDKLQWVHGIGPQGSQGLGYMMQEKRVRTGFVQSEDEVLGSLTSAAASWESGEKAEPDFSQICTRLEQEAMDMSCNAENSN